MVILVLYRKLYTNWFPPPLRSGGNAAMSGIAALAFVNKKGETMKIRFITILAFLLAATQVYAIEPVAKIIAQKGSPIEITSFSAAYQPDGTYQREGIRYEVKYKNIGDKEIVAVQMGLVGFDIWNEFMDRTGGIAIENIKPGASEEGTWVASAYAEFSFLTGFAYISKVRFSNGQIWEANLESIANEMRKIEKGFDVEKLKGKPDKK